MSTPTIIIIIVVVVLLAVVVAVLLGRNKKVKEERRDQAHELREQAGRQTPGVQDALLQADQAEAEAARLRARADQAEAEAARLRRGAAAEEAGQEDVVRRADELDPDVDDRAKDYTPGAGLGSPEPVDPALEETAPVDPAQDEAAAAGPQTRAPGSHRGEPEVPPAR